MTLSRQQQQMSIEFQQHQQVIFEDDAKIRQIIPINPNQICGITPSDIDK